MTELFYLFFGRSMSKASLLRVVLGDPEGIGLVRTFELPQYMGIIREQEACNNLLLFRLPDFIGFSNQSDIFFHEETNLGFWLMSDISSMFISGSVCLYVLKEKVGAKATR